MQLYTLHTPLLHVLLPYHELCILTPLKYYQINT